MEDEFSLPLVLQVGVMTLNFAKTNLCSIITWYIIIFLIAQLGIASYNNVCKHSDLANKIIVKMMN